ncbi:MAG: bifunctional tetrahydrofolate synthase/dihydrofolate synthase [Gammaproteobacteria bacterium]|nr:MAG: bifunctional tetrahydrofolate synthase/dihydrofolate synthase [Gammaproteobacteria bacterium]
MARRSLADWLRWQEGLHPADIELGLARVSEVARRLGLPRPRGGILTVAGTNGKGSTLRFAEAALAAAGWHCGAYSSPHLLRYNERIRIGGRPAGDAALLAAFAAVDDARGELPLTYFEFGTLAAAWLFAEQDLDGWLLEVGLGGRLDAVNVFDPDVSLITTVALDHERWLGTNREQVAAEKAGIMRAGRPAFYGSADPPAAILAAASARGARLELAGRDFGWQAVGDRWAWWYRDQRIDGLPRPWPGDAAQFDDLALALAGCSALLSRELPRASAEAAARAGSPAGRFQRVAREGREWIVDVAHNPQAMALLARRLADLPPAPRTIAVAALLEDKDIDACLAPLLGQVDAWIACELTGTRARPASELQARLSQAGATSVSIAGSPRQGCERAAAQADAGSRIVVCGSFLLAGPALEWLGLYS